MQGRETRAALSSALVALADLLPSLQVTAWRLTALSAMSSAVVRYQAAVLLANGC